MVTTSDNQTVQPSPASPPADPYAIQVDGVTKQFGFTVAVNNVSFDVKKGEIVGFLGPNGSGKSTTMRLITSYYTPDKGRVLVNGIDNQAHDVETRKMIGYLPENNPIYGDLLVSEYLSFVADLRGLSPAQKREGIARAVEETGIQEVFYNPLSQCSKGYKQRSGLAQAILHQPEILIMDEPTEGLDPNQRVPIRELIRTLGTKYGRTVMLSTHVLQEVQQVCDRLLIIRRGKIVAQGTVEELRKQAHGNRYVEMEVEGADVEVALAGIPAISPVGARQRFRLSIAGEGDPRPEIFKLAKGRDWVLWDLHEEATRLDDLFHKLTADDAPSERPAATPETKEA